MPCWHYGPSGIALVVRGDLQAAAYPTNSTHMRSRCDPQKNQEKILFGGRGETQIKFQQLSNIRKSDKQFLKADIAGNGILRYKIIK